MFQILNRKIKIYENSNSMYITVHQIYIYILGTTISDMKNTIVRIIVKLDTKGEKV